MIYWSLDIIKQDLDYSVIKTRPEIRIELSRGEAVQCEVIILGVNITVSVGSLRATSTHGGRERDWGGPPPPSPPPHREEGQCECEWEDEQQEHQQVQQGPGPSPPDLDRGAAQCYRLNVKNRYYVHWSYPDCLWLNYDMTLICQSREKICL